MTARHILLAFIAFALLCQAGSAIALLPVGPPTNLSAGDSVSENASLIVIPQTTVLPAALSIERLHPLNATPGADITVTLKVTNSGNRQVRAKVYEDQRPGATYLDSLVTKYHTYQALKIPYNAWDITLGPGATQSVTYRIRPQAVGVISFTPALVVDETGSQTEAKPTSIRVACIPNGVCDAGENTIFCPEDCPKGGSDGICDGSPDGKVDPDCVKGYDPDDPARPAATATKKGILPGPSVAATISVLAVVFLISRRRIS
jgi:hypothetical protein